MLTAGLDGAAAVLCAVVALRVGGSGRWRHGAAVVAGAPWILLAGWPLAVAGAVAGSWGVAAVAAVVAGADSWWLSQRRRTRGGGVLRRRAVRPVAGPVGTTGAGPAESFPVTFLCANVLGDNPDLTGLIPALDDLDPDVVVLEELGPWHLRSLAGSRLLDPAVYPWRLVLDDEHVARGIAVWSKVPLRDVEPWQMDDFRQLHGWLDPPGGVAVRLYAVHAPPPWPRPAAAWATGLAALERAVAAERAPVVAIGDFNATWDHRSFRKLLALGLRDAAREAGKGLAATWPTNLRLLPPCLRLDHVLVSQELGVSAYLTRHLPGSDHRLVAVTLHVPPAPSGSGMSKQAPAPRGTVHG